MNFRDEWLDFVERHVPPPNLSPLIVASWERCWPRLSANSPAPLQSLASADLLRAQVVYFELISIARPIMEDMYQYLEGSDTALLVASPAGYVLDMLGSDRILHDLARLRIQPGALLSETEMGTNAIGLALAERVPAQVCGSEHYRAPFHGIAGAAAPFYDITGKLLGAFGFISLADDLPNQSLSLAASGAHSIETQRQADQLLREQNLHLAHLDAILNTISDAILVWDRDGILVQANPAASELLNYSFEPLKGRRLNDTVRLPAFVKEAVAAGRELTDVEAALAVDGFHVDCILSLRFVRTGAAITAVVAILRHARDIRQLIQRQVGAQAPYSLEDLVGTSPAIQHIRRQVSLAAGARAGVMLRGETGTGKNLLARILHHHSPAASGPFILFPCTSIPGEMAVSELLGCEGDGHCPGGEGRPGKIELADGGTLFLQDVDALPLAAQAIVLNAIESGIVQRSNSRRAIPVSVRILSSSAGDLESLVEGGSFRRDLYYRLSPFEIHLPPLRERMEDLPPLAESILKRLSAANERSFVISPEAMALLMQYNWPLNLRELEAVLSRAISLLVDGVMIAPEHLPEFIRHSNRLVFEPARLVTAGSLDELEREALLQSARAYHGNLGRMVENLGVSRTTVWRKLKQYNIHLSEYRDGVAS